MFQNLIMAFDFERLDVYQKAKAVNSHVYSFLKANAHLPRYIRDQLGRASLSIMLNIAEGAGRFGKKEKKQFYTISRSSVFECAALLDFLLGQDLIEKTLFNSLYQQFEEISRILYRMIENLRPPTHSH